MRFVPIFAAALLTLSACSTLNIGKSEKADQSEDVCQPATYTVYFENSATTFDMGASQTLNEIQSDYMLCDLYHLELQGHADSIGDPAANMKLSNDRAEAVRDALSTRGISASHVTIIPKGEEETKKDSDSNPFERKVIIRLLPN